MGHLKSVDVNSDLVSKGKYLYETSGCDFCHNTISSDYKINKKSLSSKGIKAPNLNNSKNSIGEWSVEELISFFRNGVAKNNFKIIHGVHEGYEWLSDTDLLALSSFLKTLSSESKAPVSRKRKFSSFSFQTLNDRRVSGFVPEILKSNKVSYGKYVVDHIARCSECHRAKDKFFSTEIFLGGGQKFYVANKKKVVPPLNGKKTSFINWTKFEMIKFLKSGVTQSGKSINFEYCPVSSFSKFNNEDTLSIVEYFKSLNN
jgi:hypothetical protein